MVIIKLLFLMFIVRIWYTNYLYIEVYILMIMTMMMIKTISEANEIRIIV